MTLLLKFSVANNFVTFRDSGILSCIFWFISPDVKSKNRHQKNPIPEHFSQLSSRLVSRRKLTYFTNLQSYLKASKVRLLDNFGLEWPRTALFSQDLSGKGQMVSYALFALETPLRALVLRDKGSVRNVNCLPGKLPVWKEPWQWEQLWFAWLCSLYLRVAKKRLQNHLRLDWTVRLFKIISNIFSKPNLDFRTIFVVFGGYVS